MSLAVLNSYTPHIERLLKGAILINLATPLIVFFDILPYPFVTSKVFFLQILISLSAFFYGLLLFLEPKKYWPRVGLLHGAVILYGCVMLLSTLFSVDSARSLWANHTRMLGSFAMLHYGILFWIVSVLYDEKFSSLLRRVLLGVIFAVGVLALLEWAGVLFPNREWQRIGSTVGSPFGLSLLALYGVALSILEFYKKKRLLAAVLSIFFIALVFLTGTRGAVVAMVGGALFVGLVLVLKKSLLNLSQKKAALLVGAVSLLFVVGLFGGVAVSKLPAFDTLSSAASIGSRLTAWDISVKAALSKPLLGYGPFTFLYAFNEFYDPAAISFAFDETWFDNAHNYFFEQLSSMGMVGFFVYIGIFALALFYCWRLAKDGRQSLALAYATIVVMHALWLVFEFEEASSLLVFVIILGLLAASQKKMLSEKKVSKALPLVLMVAALLMGRSSIRSVQAAAAHQQALNYARSGEVGGWFEAQKKALSSAGPYAHSMRLDMARVFSEFELPPDASSVPLVDAVFTFMRSQMALSQEDRPLDPFAYLFDADIARRRYTIFRATADADRALQLYEKAQEVAPRRPQLFLSSAFASIDFKEFDEAKKEAYAALALAPEDERVAKLLADVLVGIYQDGEDKALLEEALGLYERVSIKRPPGTYDALYKSWSTALQLAGQPEKAAEMLGNIDNENTTRQ